MAADWRTAYFQQAKSDYGMLLKLLKEDNVPLCHSLHYLQMTTEKLAKGFRTPPGGPRPAKVHDAFTNFVKKYARLDPNLQRACGFTNVAQYSKYLEGLRDLAQKVEDLSPEGDDHPNPEYPWEQGGLIFVPMAYPFSDLDLRRQSPKMVKLLKLNSLRLVSPSRSRNAINMKIVKHAAVRAANVC